MATSAAPLSAATPQPVNKQPAPAAAPPGKGSRLQYVKRELAREAKRIHIYGPGGVGKTLLAADADRPIFCDSDTGSGHLALPRYPFRPGEPDGHVPKKLEEVYAMIDDLESTPHDFGTLVFDVSGGIERLIHTRLLAELGPDRNGHIAKTVGDVAFARGPKMALVEWRVLLDRLDRLRLKRQMHVIFVSHTVVRKYKNPTSEDYGRYEADLDTEAASALYQWSDVVAFVSFDDVGTRAGRAVKAVGQWAGRRVVHVEHAAAWDAKSRLPLPAEFDLPEVHPFAPFAAALEQLYAGAGELRTSIEAELGRLGETFSKSNGTESTAAATRTAVANAGDNTAELTKFLNVLKQAQPKQAAQEASAS